MQRIAPDDDLYRVRLVWLGPKGLSFPWVARYLAYGVWILSFMATLAFVGVMPFLEIGLPPVWEFSIATLATAIVMNLIDHERPLRAVPVVVWREARRIATRRPAGGSDAIRTARITVVPTAGGPVKAAPPVVKPPKAPKTPKAKAPKPVKPPRPARVRSVPAPRSHDRRAERVKSPPPIVAVVVLSGVAAWVAHIFQGVVTGG